MFRSRTYKTLPLHKALLEHRPNDVIEEIHDNSSPNFNFAQQDSNGRNLLQLAASRGFVQAVLWGAYAKVPINASQEIKHQNTNHHLQESEKTPLYLAVEHGHWLIAQILLILGADKNKTLDLARKANNLEVLNTLNQLHIDHDVFRAVLYWIVNNHHPVYGNNLLNLIKPQIAITETHKLQIENDEKSVSEKVHLITIDEEKIHDQVPLPSIQNDLYGIIELAAQKNLTHLVSGLFEINNQIRTDPSYATLGYWAAKNDNTEMYNLILKNDEHVFLTLQQLDEMSTQDNFGKFFALSSKEQQDTFLNLDEDRHEEKMPKKQAKIFTQAKFAEDRKLKHFKHNELNRNYFAVLDFIFESRNFVALNTLIQNTDQNKLLGYALANKKRELFFILSFLNNQYTHELMQHCPNEMNDVFALMGRNNEKDGLSYRIINHGTSGILQDLRNSKEIEAQRNYFKEMKVTENEFIKMYCKYVYERHVNNTEEALNIAPSNASIIIKHAKRFDFRLHDLQKEEKAGTRLDQLRKHSFQRKIGPAGLIIQFLDEKDKAQFSATSRATYELCASNQLFMVNHFLQELRDEINSMPCLSHRNYGITYADVRNNRGDVAFLIACSIILSISIWHLVMIKGDVRPSEPDKNGILEHAPFLSVLWMILSYAAVIGLGGASLIFILNHGDLLLNFIKVLFKGLLAGNERFNPIALTEFSDELQREADRLFAASRHYPNFGLTRASTVGEVIPCLTEMKETLQVSLSPHQLFSAPRLETSTNDATQPLLEEMKHQPLKRK